MLSNELIIKFTEEQEDIMVEFLQTLKKIMEENDKKNV